MILRILTVPFRLLWFALWFAGELLRSSLTVFADILSPGMSGTPRIVRLPLGRASDTHVTMIGVLITLTPGTLTLGAEEDGPDGERAILVHSMYHADRESALADLVDMDRRMMRAVRIGASA